MFVIHIAKTRGEAAGDFVVTHYNARVMWDRLTFYVVFLYLANHMVVYYVILLPLPFQFVKYIFLSEPVNVTISVQQLYCI